MSRYDKIIQRFSRRLNQIEEDLREKRFAESVLEREGQKRKSATGFAPRLSEFEYYQAQELKEELAERYRDQSLNKVIPGEKISNQYGTFYHISEQVKEDSFKPEKETVVSMVGDDMQFLTPNWDIKILELINHYKGIGVFWANDDYIARERLCVNMFVTRDFVEATEHDFMCELFAAEMIDYLWHKVGKYTKTLHFDPDIHIKHDHQYSYPTKDDTFNRLQPLRDAAWIGGKLKAKEIASKIAEILKKKGMVGKSVC